MADGEESLPPNLPTSQPDSAEGEALTASAFQQSADLRQPTAFNREISPPNPSPSARVQDLTPGGGLPAQSLAGGSARLSWYEARGALAVQTRVSAVEQTPDPDAAPAPSPAAPTSAVPAPNDTDPAAAGAINTPVQVEATGQAAEIKPGPSRMAFVGLTPDGREHPFGLAGMLVDHQLGLDRDLQPAGTANQALSGRDSQAQIEVAAAAQSATEAETDPWLTTNNNFVSTSISILSSGSVSGSASRSAPASDPAAPASDETDVGRDTVEVPHLNLKDAGSKLARPAEDSKAKARPSVNMHLPGSTYSGAEGKAAALPFLKPPDGPRPARAIDEMEATMPMESPAKLAQDRADARQKARGAAPSDKVVGDKTTIQIDQQNNDQTSGHSDKEDPYKYVVIQGDTVESVAQSVLHDPALAALLFSLNRRYVLPEESYGVHPIMVGVVIQLPTPAEIVGFRKSQR